MPRREVSMRNAREVLRLRLGCGLSVRQVASSCGVSTSTVSEYEKRIREAGLGWPLPENIDDEALERLVRSGQPTGPSRSLPDINYIVTELAKSHVTLNLLWLEYRETNPDGYGYTQFCHWIKENRAKLDVTLRHFHKAGEKVFTDYAGDTLSIVDPRTGEIVPVYMFVACLGASNYTYAEGVLSMSEASWISSHINAFEYFGGVPQIVVPDNTKCAVIKPDRYEPDINPSFSEMAAHYGTAVIPARVRKPRDKAKVENAVLVAERWIIASLRNRRFYSIHELNDAIAELLEKLNARKFKMIASSRVELFNKTDKPALGPLPSIRYVYGQWKKATVNIDYHIAIEKHFYSVPYQFSRKQVDVRISATTVEVFFNNTRIASHVRSLVEGDFSLNPEHMPKSHKEHLEWTPSRIINWARNTGPATAELVEKILESRPHPEMGYRSCLGIIRLSKKYPIERMEAAAKRALAIHSYSCKSVKSILEKGLDRKPLEKQLELIPATNHANIRGPEYYRN